MKNESTEVAIVSPGLPPRGPVDELIYHHARLLDRAGFGLRTLAGHGDPAYWEATFDLRMDFFLLPELAYGPSLEDEGHRERLAASLRSRLSGAKVWLVYDVFASHKDAPLAAILYSLAQELGAHLIAWTYTCERNDFAGALWPGVSYVAASPDVAGCLAASGLPAEMIQTIPAGINPFSLSGCDPAASQLVERLRLLDCDLLALHPGPAALHGQVDLALRVLANLKTSFPRLRLVVGGRTEQDRQAAAEDHWALRALAADLGLRDRIHFLCPYCEPDLPDELPGGAGAGLYRLADLLFYPGFGEINPLLEAGLARLPVVAPDSPEMRALLGGQGVLFAPADSPPAIAAAIAARLHSDPAHSMRRRVLENFTWGAIFEQHIRPLIESAST